MKSWSVRGSETPGRLVALESETFFDFSRALSVDFSFNFCLVFAACYLFKISESSFWYDRITQWAGNLSICCCCCCGWWAGAVCARGGDAWGAGASEGGAAGGGEAWAAGGGEAAVGGGDVVGHGDGPPVHNLEVVESDVPALLVKQGVWYHICATEWW